MHGSELLKKWREGKGFTLFDASKVIDISGNQLSSYELRRTKPGLASALAIAKGTDGAVPAESWAGTPSA